MNDRKRTRTVSLWKLIERMQRRMEAEGLAGEAADVAITRGLAAWIDAVPPLREAHRRHGRFPSWAAPPAIAKG
jgi:hypothetical protein